MNIPVRAHGDLSLEFSCLTSRTYPQNIDMLDVLAGVSEEKMIECHGHFRSSSCVRCSRPFDGDECKRIIIEEKRAPTCLHCKGYVKPDIVFFGESLPPKFHSLVRQDTKRADLLLVMGTCECLVKLYIYIFIYFGGWVRYKPPDIISFPIVSPRRSTHGLAGQHDP